MPPLTPWCCGVCQATLRMVPRWGPTIRGACRIKRRPSGKGSSSAQVGTQSKGKQFSLCHGWRRRASGGVTAAMRHVSLPLETWLMYLWPMYLRISLLLVPCVMAAIALGVVAKFPLNLVGSAYTLLATNVCLEPQRYAYTEPYTVYIQNTSMI